MDQQQGSQPETPQVQSAPATQDVQPQQATPPQQTDSAITESTASTTPPDSTTPPNNAPRIISSETTPQGKSKSTFFITAIALVVIIAGMGFLLISKQHIPQKITQTTITPTVSEQSSQEVTPVTSANVDQTLNNADNTMQQTVNQANTDLNNVSTIDSSQDNTSGL